jgi:hypothetical protein
MRYSRSSPPSWLAGETVQRPARSSRGGKNALVATDAGPLFDAPLPRPLADLRLAGPLASMPGRCRPKGQIGHQRHGSLNPEMEPTLAGEEQSPGGVLASERLNQPAKRVAAEGCRGKALRRATIYSLIYAGVPFRSETRS